ncbi:acyl carrier protein [Kutzneria chonburiensis]|uniref:Acyl carrier protein n=1 Tax=Kutzneria chonburiensis TaxID=1483604 RepID=A0ABV6N6U5_9PSEU|nr:phosphopantetheine-binding protein [Kutzneria chonburiensis]
MTTSTSVEQTVLDVLSQILDTTADELRAQPALASHDWDSFSSLEALAQLESALGVRFDLRTFNAAVTVHDVIALAA